MDISLLLSDTASKGSLIYDDSILSPRRRRQQGPVLTASQTSPPRRNLDIPDERGERLGPSRRRVRVTRSHSQQGFSHIRRFYPPPSPPLSSICGRGRVSDPSRAPASHTHPALPERPPPSPRFRGVEGGSRRYVVGVRRVKKGVSRAEVRRSIWCTPRGVRMRTARRRGTRGRVRWGRAARRTEGCCRRSSRSSSRHRRSR